MKGGPWATYEKSSLGQKTLGNIAIELNVMPDFSFIKKKTKFFLFCENFSFALKPF